MGLSGGVDSSVSAALLKKAGHEVTGVFIKGWHPDWGPCGWQEDRLDAMRVCAHLGIPFRDLDLSREYKKEVVDYMIREYRAGRTPNPDVMCNRYIKFGAFFDYAVKNGADFVATGHYASRFLFTKIEDPRFCKAKSGLGLYYCDYCDNRQLDSLDRLSKPCRPTRRCSSGKSQVGVFSILFSAHLFGSLPQST